MQNIVTNKKTHLLITSTIFALTLTGSIFWFMSPPVVTQGDTETGHTVEYSYPEKHVIVNLNTMTITLNNGSTTIATYPILSQGKPGSYYETIGGAYESDYKIPLHFSSIGHVYMPYSVHVFGNYFIHGIPYYPDGTPVSSAYSGGCIRLTNENAKIVYGFIEKGTPVIITRDSEKNFDPTPTSSSTMISQEMTNFMVATISLEALTQDNEILGTRGEVTTRRKLLPELLNEGNPLIARLFAGSIGTGNFVHLMNQKAEALGLSNTHFSNVNDPVETTYEDYMRFMTHITTYKSYLRAIAK